MLLAQSTGMESGTGVQPTGCGIPIRAGPQRGCSTAFAFLLVVRLRKPYKDGVNLSVQLQPSACTLFCAGPRHGRGSLQGQHRQDLDRS